MEDMEDMVLVEDMVVLALEVMEDMVDMVDSLVDLTKSTMWVSFTFIKPNLLQILIQSFQSSFLKENNSSNHRLLFNHFNQLTQRMAGLK